MTAPRQHRADLSQPRRPDPPERLFRRLRSWLDRIGAYVVPGDDPEKPRADLKRPWEAVARRAGLDGVRLHDLRHTYASFGAGGGLGLPIIGKVFGHTQASTTLRYARLDADPLRRASEATGGRIAAALDGKRAGSLVQLKGGRRP
jgi:integrase